MKLSVRSCVAVVAALSVVVIVEHVEAREVGDNERNFVAPRFPEDRRLTRLPYSHVSSDSQRRQLPRQNIHSRPYTQEELDERNAYLASQRLGSRYHFSRGQADTSNARTVATIRHEPIIEQHVRIGLTEPPIIQGSTHDPAASASRTHTTGDESYSRVHQMGPYTTHERRRHPYARDSYDSRVPSASRDRLYGVPQQQQQQQQQHAGIDNKVSHGDDRMNRTSLPAEIEEQVHNALLASSIRPERPSHNRHMVPTTRTRSSLTREPSLTLTSGLSRELDAAERRPSKANDEGENVLQQLQDWPDRCCGSKVPFDPRTGTPTGTFQRVAAAGSLKVVSVPVRDSFPPSDVRDLLATPLDPHTLYLTWTAPGGDLDSGTVSGYIIRLSETRQDLQESQFDAAAEDTVLQTSEALTEAGVYQPAGTRVNVEVPLARPLQRGHVYYVAFRARDDNGLSSHVSNVARFTVLGSSTVNNSGASNSGPPIHERIYTQVEEAARTTALRGSTLTNGEIGREATGIAPLPGSNTESGQHGEPIRGGISEEHSLRSATPQAASVPEASESEGSENQRKRKKDRKKKNKRAKRRRKDGRRNGRRDDRQREGTSDTSVWNSHILDIYAELERWKES